ncbi:MAG TPA: Maf family nucleotide pyrophosphatase [Bacteroidales bacterium]|nr:Maf family nucleotide pyrophosphatase [Bacteroidales bacterium]
MVFGLPEKNRFVLASRSPRRQQLLKEAGFEFAVRVIDYDEEIPSGMNGREIAEHLSRRKASYFDSQRPGENEIIITADTIVWCDGKVLDKPVTHDDAMALLRLISAKTHEVITAVSLVSSGRIHTFSETTRVTFTDISEEEIAYYVENFRPFDKAGGYGIQEWIGVTANSRIEGSYFNVMGLPVQRLIRELREFIRQAENLP